MCPIVFGVVYLQKYNREGTIRVIAKSFKKYIFRRTIRSELGFFRILFKGYQNCKYDIFKNNFNRTVRLRN